ncbi:hypothetical protein pb186bvf_007699 [Paramecium bursaria]
MIKKNFQSKIDSILGEILWIGKLEYVSLLLEDDALTQLYHFAQSNKFTDLSDQQICNESILREQQYHGVFQQDQKYSQIQQYIQLQQQFIPFTKLNKVQTYYTFSLNSECYFIYNEGGEQKQLLENIKKIRNIIQETQSPVILQSFIYNGQYLTEVFLKISQDTVIGKSFKQAYGIYRQLLTDSRVIDIKYYFISTNGLIISNAQNQDFNGKYFQNPNISGFNQLQLDQIVKNSQIYPGNNCGYKYQLDIYCLKDYNNKTQLIFSTFTTQTQMILFILDEEQLKEIQIIFNQELNLIINHSIQQQMHILGIVLVVSFIIQYILIYFLNRPLVQIQQMAKCQISNNSIQMQNIMIQNKQQSQIQLLCDSFYNLIYINQKLNRRIPQQFMHITHDQNSNQGLIWNRYYRQQPIFKLYKQIKDNQQL